MTFQKWAAVFNIIEESFNRHRIAMFSVRLCELRHFPDLFISNALKLVSTAMKSILMIKALEAFQQEGATCGGLGGAVGGATGLLEGREPGAL
jgi:hypothetical protein